MRRGLRILSTTVLVGVVATSAIADGPVKSGTKAVYFSRGGAAGTQARETATPKRFVRQQPEDKQVKPVPGIRNYHRELFGGAVSAEKKPVRSTTPNQIRRAGYSAPATPKSGSQPKAIVNATYKRPGDKKEWDTIEMIGATADARPERLTIPTTPRTGSDELTETKAPALSLEWRKQGDVNVGQECTIELVVANDSESGARDVEVEAFFPNTVRLVATDPKPAESKDRLTWSFDAIDARATESIEIRLIPARRGPLATKAHVRFTGAASGAFNVQEPLLELAISGPKEIHIGDPASQIVTVSNPGTGIARNVVVEAIVPKGLEHTKGSKLVTDIGTLNPGESRQVRLALAAIGGGAQTVTVNATAAGSLRKSTEATVAVIAPSLNVELAGPGLRYLGRPADYLLTVANDGTAPTDNVRVVHRVPEGFEFVKSSRGGKYVPVSRQVQWFVGRLQPGQKITLAAQLEPKRMGNFEHRAGAISEHGARGEAVKTTRVEGSSSLVLEVADLDDPVEIGAETAYEIRVRNDGTAAASGVGISCELPKGMQLLGAKGPTAHVGENGLVVFKSLAALAPGKTALFRVRVRGTAEGNQRFRARLVSESIKEPLTIEELTKFYTGE